MEFTVGEIVEGKVKSITSFGAFIALPEGKTGMVHISEVAHAYVADIRQHLTEGQDVKVMVLAIDPNGKINLSIKRTLPQEHSAAPRRGFDKRPDTRPPQQSAGRSQSGPPNRSPRQQSESFSRYYTPAPPKDLSFEDKLKQFMNESDSKLSSLKEFSDHKTKTRRR
ncbi:MAG: S1 RNA-binding domain-containing protein [Oscillospiraceae bacterium]|nr:S1 RNA-binding domain-containing protein [Oscillospiraceae bacterium]